MATNEQNKNIKGSAGRWFSSDQNREFQANVDARDAALSQLGNVGSITSRDQIINPYEMITPDMYRNTRAGRAQYESDLASLFELQKQQNAAYEEWYESPEQQAIRDRSAGLNPDLLGLSDGEAAEAAPGEAVPGQGLPTNGEMIANGVTSIASLLSSVVGGVASLAALPSTISANVASAGVSRSLSTAQDIRNTSDLSTIIGDEISALYGAALQDTLDNPDTPFDTDAWFADDANFSVLRESYGKFPNFDAVLSSQRKQILRHKRNAAQLQKDWASDQFDFGMIYSDPYFSPSQKIMIPQQSELQGYFRDVDVARAKYEKTLYEIEEQIKRGLDVDTAVDAANAQNEYLANIDGRKKAAQEAFMRDCEVARLKRIRRMHDHLFKAFENDPTSAEAAAATFLIGGLVPDKYGTFMAAYAGAHGRNAFGKQRKSFLNFFRRGFEADDDYSYSKEQDLINYWEFYHPDVPSE